MARPVEPWRAEYAQKACNALLPKFRDTARQLGYALALHGSVAYDVDLVAVPWVSDAEDATTLIAALYSTALAAGCATYLERDLDGTPKPHGRRAWNIHLFGTYFDVSVLPRGPAAPRE